jgi:hypothetical protein
MVWPPPCIEGNKVRGGSARSLIVKMAESGLGEALRRPTCAWGRLGAIHEVTLTGSLALAKDSLREAPTGTRRKLERFSIRKNTKVVDGSLHLYRPFTFRIYIVILVVCFIFPSIVDKLVDRIRI